MRILSPMTVSVWPPRGAGGMPEVRGSSHVRVGRFSRNTSFVASVSPASSHRRRYPPHTTIAVP
eukprot:scaffold241583_cov30-Tisochrysis_lutea.AAC.2